MTYLIPPLPREKWYVIDYGPTKKGPPSQRPKDEKQNFGPTSMAVSGPHDSEAEAEAAMNAMVAKEPNNLKGRFYLWFHEPQSES